MGYWQDVEKIYNTLYKDIKHKDYNINANNVNDILHDVLIAMQDVEYVTIEELRNKIINQVRIHTFREKHNGYINTNMDDSINYIIDESSYANI